MLGLVTAEVAAPLDPDLLPLDAAMRDRLGDDRVRIVAWDDTEIDWSSFDAVILRSSWDYADRLAEFLDWVERVDAVATLINGAGVIRWSADKRYLIVLAEEGVEIIPTVFVAPGEAPPPVSGLHVAKPTVGAGSNGARRCESGEVADHVALLHAQGRTAMVQPYLDRLDDLGETVRASGPMMFARVDIAPHRDDDGTDGFVVMEVELIEPSFFFETALGSVYTFADTLTVWLESTDRHDVTGGS